MKKRRQRNRIFAVFFCTVLACPAWPARAESIGNVQSGYQVIHDTVQQPAALEEMTASENSGGTQNWESGMGSIPKDYENRITSFIPSVKGACRTSFICQLSAGGYQTAIYENGKIYVQDYDSSFQASRSCVLDLELPIWGGIFLGKEHNYVVCGKGYSSSEDKGGEVFRIIKYDKDFNRLGSKSLNGEETFTSVPFESGNVSIDENGEILTVYTSRLRLDGHQSNISVQIRTENMELLSTDGMGEFPSMHVSHSFRQIVSHDEGGAVYADVSDGSPKRSVFVQGSGLKKSVMDIAGQDGNNLTNAELSGLAVTDTGYLIAGSYLKYDENNVFLAYLDKATGYAEKTWLTDSTAFQPKYVCYPRIAEAGAGRYAVMWSRFASGSCLTDYVIVDGSGSIISGLKSVNADITDCEPIFADGKIVWLSIKNGKQAFNQISDLSEGGSFECGAEIVQPENPWDGQADTSWYQEAETEFSINTPQQLAGLAQLVNQGNTFAGKKVSLENDIFLNDNTYQNIWTPIGICKRGETSDNVFEGVFDGKKHSVYNMLTDDSMDGGLFGCIGKAGLVKSVDISQGYLYSGGCIANVNKGIIAFCNNYSSTGINRSSNLGEGGICNENQNLIYGCKNYGEVWGSSPGGIAGMNAPDTAATISQCSNYGLVRGNGDAAGIVNYNYTWVTNCYNLGAVADTYDGVNRARSLSGIAYRSREGHIENCYSAGIYSYSIAEGELRVLRPICTESDSESVANCYVLESGYFASAENTVSEDEIKSPGFIEKIDRQNHSVLSVWRQDAGFINNGFPVTVADISCEKGECKIQPEAWILNGKKEIEAVLEKGTYELSFECYYNESEPEVTVKDSVIASVEKKGSGWVFQLHQAGKTQVQVHFEETEHNSSADYVFTLCVESNGSTDSVKIEKITLSVSDASLNEGKTLQLVAEIFPADAANKNLKWTSDNENVASVRDGTVYASGIGKAVITAESQDGSGVRASCAVNVTKKPEENLPDNNPGENEGGDNTEPGDNITPDKPSDGSQGGNKPGNNPSGGNQDGNNTGSSGGNAPGGITPGGSSGGNAPGGIMPGGNPSGSTQGNIPGNTGQPAIQQDDPIKIELLYYVVEFNANAGTRLSRKTMTLLNNDSFGILPKVQRENYIFNGWYTQKSGGTKVNSATVLNAGTTLYAQWSKAVKPSKGKVISLKFSKTGQLVMNFQKMPGAKGYETAYSVNKKFPVSSTKKKVSSGTKQILDKLKSGKTYYVKVRAFQIDSTGKKVYGAYSAVKSIQVK